MLLVTRKIPFMIPNPDYICDENGVCPDITVTPKEFNVSL